MVCIAIARITGHRKNAVVGKVRLEVLGGPDDVITVEVDNRLPVKSGLQPLGISNLIVCMVALS